MTVTGPRQAVTPFRPIPLEVPAGMALNAFFNSAENLNDLINNNGLLSNPENLVLYRKALGHSNEFDTSIIYDTSRSTRPARAARTADAGAARSQARLESDEPNHHRVYARNVSGPVRSSLAVRRSQP